MASTDPFDVDGLVQFVNDILKDADAPKGVTVHRCEWNEVSHGDPVITFKLEAPGHKHTTCNIQVKALSIALANLITTEAKAAFRKIDRMRQKLESEEEQLVEEDV